MAKVDILVECPKCGGGGIFPFEYVNGEGVPHPPEVPQVCSLCNGDKKIATRFKLTKNLVDDIEDVKDLCTQILAKLYE